jgi:protoporphyrinogen/coproporphyrinogen III oxidase
MRIGNSTYREVLMGKTVIIGGGTSGLAAAYTLQKAGVECTVLEKRDFSGGRIAGAERDGFILDLGAQFFFRRYPTTYDLMRQLGIYDQLVKWMSPIGILRDGTVHVVSPKIKDNLRHPTSALRFDAVSSRGKRMGMKMGLDLLRMGKKLDFDDPLKAIELDNISVADYALRHWGEEILEYAIQPVDSALTLGVPEDISAAYGLALLWYGIRGLRTTTKGIGYLAKRLAEDVKDLNLNTEVTRIVLEGTKVKGVEIKNGSKTEFMEADNVICGALAHQAAGLLPDLPSKMTDTLTSIKYSACTHVMIATKGKVLGDVYGVATPRREGLGMVGFTDSAHKAPTYAPPNTSLINVFTYGDIAREMLEWSDEKVQEHVIRELQTVVPQFPDEPIFCEIFRWPEAVCLSSPGQITSVQKLKVAMREFNGLELVGEYFGMPSVEAALNSGVKASQKIIKSC